VVLVARARPIHLERETAIALVRGFVQIVAVGSVLVLLLDKESPDGESLSGPATRSNGGSWTLVAPSIVS
jgi:hypothetical protein